MLNFQVQVNERAIFLTDSVINIFEQFRSLHRRHESGGIVLGQVDKTERRILVSRASIPNELDKSAKYNFHRDMRAARQIVEYEFYNSLVSTHPPKGSEGVPSRF
jgi:hypothetical protein